MKACALALIVLIIATPAGAQPAPTVKGDAAAWDEVKAAMQGLVSLKSYRMRMMPAPGAMPAPQTRGAPPQGADKMTMVNEFVNPGRMRVVMDMPDMMTIEMIKVDKEFRRRITLKGELAEAAKAQPSVGQQIFSGFGSIVQAVLDPVGFIIGVVTNNVMSAIMQSMLPKTPKFGVWTCEEAASGAGSPTDGSPGSSLNAVSVARLPDTTIDGAKARAYDVTMGAAQDGKPMTTHTRAYVLADRPVIRRMEMLKEDGSLYGTMDFVDFEAPITIELPKCE